METKKINDRFSFNNSYCSIREGFRHTSTLFVDGKRKKTVSCDYANRTWENYPFQTCMKKCVRLVIAKTKDENELIALNELLTKLGD